MLPSMVFTEEYQAQLMMQNFKVKPRTHINLSEFNRRYPSNCKQDHKQILKMLG